MSDVRLAIARDLALPLDAVTQKLAFLGRTGSGKTYAATKLAELMLEELHRRVFARLNDGEAKILRTLIAYHPEGIARAALGAETGYNLSGGTPAGYVGKLVTLDFATIPRPGELRANDLLFPEGL